MGFKGHKASGEIAVFMALILSVIILLVLAVLSNVRRYTARYMAQIAVDSALLSGFGEYNKELFDRYHLMYLDPSYKSSENSLQLFSDHITAYLLRNLPGNNGNRTYNSLHLTDVQVDSVSTIGNLGNKDILDQICYYQKRKNGINNEDSISSEAALMDYIQSTFSNCQNDSEQKARSGEIEYLIYGYGEDFRNINKARQEYEDEKELSVITYDDFLTYMLQSIDEDTLVDRICFLISEYLRENESPEFDFDKCITGASLTVKMELMDEEILVTGKYSYR